MLAARFGDMTAHGGTITGPGCTTVLIGKMPAARMGDMHMCPMVTPGTPPIPHVGGPIVGGCPTVLIGKMPAARQTDMCICAGPPSSVMMGCPTVMIGSGAGGGASGGGGSSTAQAKAAQALQAGKISPVKGTESYPIEIQALALVMQKYCTPEGEELDLEVIEALAKAREAEGGREEELAKLTIKDFVEILKETESEKNYETANYYARRLNHDILNDKARAFINGEDTNPDNAPNIMPTRFMLLWGADDKKLQEINEHPDDSKHKITVENLKKALRCIGYDLPENGIYDDKVDRAVEEYCAGVKEMISEKTTRIVEKGENLGDIADEYGLSSWKQLYEMNKDKIGDNPDVLEAGIELDIPQFDISAGDEKLSEKDADPSLFTDGRSFVYPWVTMSVTLAETDGSVYKEKAGDSESKTSFEKKKKYEIKNSDTDETIVSGEVESSEELCVFVPDIRHPLLVIDGEEYEMWTGEGE